MLISRVFTKSHADIENLKYKSFDVSIKDHRNGKIIYEMKGIEAPEAWSQQSVEICSSKYFRRAGVPSKAIQKTNQYLFFPEWLNPSVPAEGATFGSETSVRQVLHRLAGAWTYWAWQSGLLRKSGETELTNEIASANAQAFYDEVFWMMYHQYAAPNSPQFFNTGLWWAYGIDKKIDGGYFYVDETGKMNESTNLYQRNQAHACFILGVEDNLIEKDGIYDLLRTEAKIFKLGSGSGTNYSNIRGENEPLSGGGVSSGLMSFLKIFDRAADSIKSGGTVRRSARLCSIDDDHPSLEAFISWKQDEGKKIKALVAAGYDGGMDGEATRTVSGQNSNNSVSLSHDFMYQVKNNGDWHLWNRVDKKKFADKRGVCDLKSLFEKCKPAKTIKAKELWKKIASAAWECADPGLHFNGTMNDWNTLLDTALVRSTNPCSEVVLPDEFSCNLLSINVEKFNTKEESYDVELYKHTIEIGQIILETVNSMAHLPTEKVAFNTHRFRATGMGIANLGTFLMGLGVAYGSDMARTMAAWLMSIMTAQSYVTSAKMAQELGPFPGWSDNSSGMLRVIRNHRRAAYGMQSNRDKNVVKSLGDYEGLIVKPHITEMNEGIPVPPLAAESRRLWDEALSLGGSYGFRNCACTSIAPTGTISFIMGCETTGIEPCYALVTYKTLSGGGTMKLVVPSVKKALENLGYNEAATKLALKHIEEHGTMAGCSVISPENRKVFICAASPIKDDVISWEDHVLMTAALQPFVSGGISKTINMPEDATENDIIKAYELAYETGCKGITVYRDGCKGAAPLSVKQTKTETKGEKVSEESLLKEISGRIGDQQFVESVEAVLQKRSHAPGEWGLRKHPKELMHGFRHKISIGGSRGYIETFHYEDNRIAEIFMTFGNPGSSLSNVMECWAIAFSVSLQRGEPLGKLCQKFIGVEFEPKGFTGRRDDLKKVSSPIDYVARLLLKTFDENGVLRKDAFDHENKHKHEKKDDEVMKQVPETKMINLASRPMCPQCGALMTGGTDKCPSCEKCGFFGGCGG